jgi:hypothetical protein
MDKKMSQLDKLYLALVIFMLLLLFCFSADSYGQTLSGSGTEGDPYLIYTLDDLVDMNNYAYNGEKHFKQMADLDLSDSTDWTPIWSGQQMKNFYDGNGYKIKHMQITSWSITSQRKRGLFSEIAQAPYTGGIYPILVTDVTFDSCTIDYNITSYGYTEYTGFLAGVCYDNGLSNVLGVVHKIRVMPSCTINIVGRPYSLYLGGIVGRGRVDNSIFSGTINWETTSSVNIGYVGGIAGLCNYSFNNLFDGKITVQRAAGADETSDKYFVGGITGSFSDSMAIVVSRGTIVGGSTAGSSYTGGLGGRVFGGDHIYQGYSSLDSVYDANSFGYILGGQESTPTTEWSGVFYAVDSTYRDATYNAMFSNNGTDTTGWKKTGDFLQNQDSLEAYGWDFDTDWYVAENVFDGYPVPYTLLGFFLPPVTITSTTDISEPIKANTSIVLTWTGEGSYDSVLVNGTYVNDSTYTYPIPDTSGQYSISIVSIENITESDTVHLYIVPGGEIILYYDGFEDYPASNDEDLPNTNWKYEENSAISSAYLIEDGQNPFLLGAVSRTNYFLGSVGDGGFNSQIIIQDTVQTIAFPGSEDFTYAVRFDLIAEQLTLNGYFRILEEEDGAVIYDTNFASISDGFHTIIDTFQITTTTTASTLEFLGRSQNGSFQIDNVVITQLSGLGVDIKTPEEGDFVSNPFTVEWTGTGTYDSVTVNGVTVPDDSSYTFTNAPPGLFDITVKSLEDSSVLDQVQVKVVQLGTVTIDDAYIESNQIKYEVTLSGIDTLLFYIGQDSVNLTYVGMETFEDTLFSGLKTFSNPEGFFGSGNLWFAVIEDQDTTQIIATPDVERIGNRGGVLICWGSAVSSAIEVLGIRDLGCGWVSGITYIFTNSTLVLQNGQDPSTQTLFENCPPADRPCDASKIPRYAFTYVDTLTSDTTDSFYPDEIYYNNTGTNGKIVYEGRRYFLYNEDIYYDNLVSGEDSIFYIDLDPYYNPPNPGTLTTNMIDPYLTLFAYETINEPVRYNGSEGLTAAMDDQHALDTPIIVIHEPFGFEGSWWFVPEINEPNPTTIASDYFQNTGTISYESNFFRGIFPKAYKRGVL